MIVGRSSPRRRTKAATFTKSRFLCWALPALLLLVTAQHLQAQHVLDYLPKDSLGFVLIRDLTESSERYEQLQNLFDAPFPAPLAFVKFATDLGPGVDFEGDVMVAFVPGSQPASLPEPLVLLPISSYEQFATSVSADGSGEVSRATIVGEDVLVARHGPYAMIMNVKNRETLEILVDLEPKPVAHVEPLTDWFEDNLATIGVMPKGVEMLLDLGNKSLSDQRRVFGNDFGGPELSTALVQIHRNNALFQALLDASDEKFNLIAAGLSIDEASNVRIGLRLLTNAKGPTAAAATNPMSPLAGSPDQSFVLAGGGPVDGSWVDLLIKAGVRIMRQMPEMYGYEHFEQQQWQDLEASYQNLAQGVRSASVLMLPGEKGQPLVGNVFVTAKVDDAKQYLEMPKKTAEIWNRLTNLSTTDIPLIFEIRDTKVGGAEACELVVDVAAAARDPNVPVFNWMLDALFGRSGKLQALVVALDEKTIVCGLADQRRMAQVMDQVRRRESGLQNSTHLQTTDKLFTPAAAWKLFVSPQGCVTWTKRIADELLGQIMLQTTEIPDFDACPPVGISLHLHEGQAEVDLVCPVESLKALADYIKKCEEL